MITEHGYPTDIILLDIPFPIGREELDGQYLILCPDCGKLWWKIRNHQSFYVCTNCNSFFNLYGKTFSSAESMQAGGIFYLLPESIKNWPVKK